MNKHRLYAAIDGINDDAAQVEKVIEEKKITKILFTTKKENELFDWLTRQYNNSSPKWLMIHDTYSDDSMDLLTDLTQNLIKTKANENGIEIET